MFYIYFPPMKLSKVMFLLVCINLSTGVPNHDALARTVQVPVTPPH